MKNYLCLSLAITALLSACRDHVPDAAQDNSAANKKKTTIQYSSPDVLPVDSANKMLTSYLNSINYEHNDTDIESIILDAKLLRKYLDSISGSDDIAYVKLAFAHKLSYINSGHGDQYAGYKNTALTIVVAGFTANGDYVFYPDHLVVDNSMACPTNCPSGTAADPFFPVISKKR